MWSSSPRGTAGTNPFAGHWRALRFTPIVWKASDKTDRPGRSAIKCTKQAVSASITRQVSDKIDSAGKKLRVSSLEEGACRIYLQPRVDATRSSRVTVANFQRRVLVPFHPSLGTATQQRHASTSKGGKSIRDRLTAVLAKKIIVSHRALTKRQV